MQSLIKSLKSYFENVLEPRVHRNLAAYKMTWLIIPQMFTDTETIENYYKKLF